MNMTKAALEILGEFLYLVLLMVGIVALASASLAASIYISLFFL